MKTIKTMDTIEDILEYILSNVKEKTGVSPDCIGGIQLVYMDNQAVIWYRESAESDECNVHMGIDFKPFSLYKEKADANMSYKKISDRKFEGSIYPRVSVYSQDKREVIISMGMEQSLDIIRIYFKKVKTYKLTEEEIKRRKVNHNRRLA